MSITGITTPPAPATAGASSPSPVRLSPNLKSLQLPIELDYIISPSEVIFYDPIKNRMRMLQLVPGSITSAPLVKEFIYSPSAPTYDPSKWAGCLKPLIDPATLWKRISSEEPVAIEIKYSKCTRKASLEEISQVCIAPRPKGFIGLVEPFEFVSGWTDDQLISEITDLDRFIRRSYFNTSASGSPKLYIDIIWLTKQLQVFLRALRTVEDPENLLDRILPRISEQDKWILFKYLSTTEMGLITAVAFKKVAQHVNPDLSKIENLIPFFYNEISEDVWIRLFPFLQACASPVSDRLSPELEKLVLTALERAVKCKNPGAIRFLLRIFPFLKETTLKGDSRYSVFLDDSDPINPNHVFSNAFYSVLNSADVACLAAFLDAGWNPNKKDKVNIISKLFEQIEHTPDLKVKPFTAQQGADRQQALILLLERGLEVNFKMEGTSGLPSTMAETLFMRDDPEIKKVALFLFDRGAVLTDKVVEKMKLDLRDHPEYAEVLIRHQKITPDEIRCLQLIASGESLDSRDSLMIKMSTAKTTMAKLHRRYTANPFIEDFKALEEIRALKKQVKKYIVAHSEDIALRDVYGSFSCEYDAIVTSHYLLSQLKQVSKELRDYVDLSATADGAAAGASSAVKRFLSKRVLALFSLWHPLQVPLNKQATILINAMDRTSRSADWQLIRGNLLKYVAQINSDGFWSGKKVTCVHGTKLVPDMCKTRALLPAGMMLGEAEGAIVQFSGERWGTYNGFNKEHSSSAKPAKNWDDLAVKMTHPVPSPILVAEVYAKQVIGYADSETIFDPEVAKERANWQFIVKSVFQHIVQSSFLRALQHCYTDILRLRAWDPMHNEYLDPLLTKIRQELANAVIPDNQKQALELLEKALTVKIKYPLDVVDRKLITHPMPIVFASSNISPIPVQKVLPLAGITNEVLIKGRADFGKDLQAAFVSEEDLPRASELLTSLGLAVYPFPILHAVETRAMMEGAHRKERGQSMLSVAKSSGKISDQSMIGCFLQQDILPAYGRPLAQRPSYKDADEVLRVVERPFWGREFRSYEAYKQALEQTDTIARSIHGRMHAVRTSIAAQLWANVYSEIKGDIVAPNRRLLAMAAAAHDGQREDEGEDHWDRASGSAFYSYLASQDYPKEVCELYGHALSHKDPIERDSARKPVFASDVQAVIHDADVLEIMRVLRNKTDFRISELAVIGELEWCKGRALPENLAKIAVMENDLAALVAQWGEFIEITESSALKMLLEYTPSIDYYTEVMKILKYLTDRGQLLTLKKCLAIELDQITGEPSGDVKKLLD